MAKLPKRVAIIGLDCAEPHLIKKHIEEGYLPTFKKLFEGGVLADNCLPPYPTITPPNWTSIGTGAWPGTHQVTDFHLHKPGTTPVNANTFEAFSSENCKAEYIWDRLDAAGKKCIVCNFPGSWPSKMKNGIMVSGAGLGFGESRNGLTGLNSQLLMGLDQIVTNGFYPRATKIKFEDASNWKNLPDGAEEPLASKFEVRFRQSIWPMAPLFWYVLITQSGPDGYDRVTVSTTEDTGDALFSIGKGEWSKKVYYKFKKQDGSEIEAAFRAKLLQLSDDAEDFLLFFSEFDPVEGWSNPPEIARQIRSEEGIFTHTAGLLGYSLGTFEADTYTELAEMHDIWLGDAVTQLMTKHPWDLFCMHSHPIDWVYHSHMTEMDDVTSTSKEKQKQAWEVHLKIHQSQDRMLARIIEAAGPDTLIVMVSDHGAVSDGTNFNPYIPLIQHGLCFMEGQAEAKDIKYLEKVSEQIEADFKEKQGERIGSEIMEMFTRTQFNPDIARSKAIPQRTIYVYVNLKGRDPGGIVEEADYEKVQQQIIDALYSYIDPVTGRRPVSLALSKKDARILGLYGEGVGDVVYALYPEFGGQHGPHLATAEWGIGKLKTLQSYYGPGIKKGLLLERTTYLIDLVPTVCYLMGWPVPSETEGCVLYQVFADPDFKSKEINKLRDGLARMETALQRGERQPWDKHECA